MGKPGDTVRAGLTAVLVLAAAAYGAWQLGGHAWEGRDTNFFLEALRTQQVDEDRWEFSRCIKAEHAVIDRVLHGQLSLAEAATALCATYDSRPERIRRDLPSLFHMTAKETYLRLVLLWAETEHGDYPDRDVVLRSLREQYEAMRGRPAPRLGDIFVPFDALPAASAATSCAGR